MTLDDLSNVTIRLSLIDRKVNNETRNFQLKVTLKANHSLARGAAEGTRHQPLR